MQPDLDHVPDASSSVVRFGWGAFVHRGLLPGFTLVELVVVMAIILILAAILLPVFERALKSAGCTTCLMNVRHLGMAARLYADDYDGLLPPAVIDIPNSSQQNCWDILLMPYLRCREMYLCPADENPTEGPAHTNSLRHSYGANLDVTMVGGYSGASRQLGQLPRSCTTILYFDMQQPQAYGWRASWGNMSQYVAGRHNQRANFVFCGGNAKGLAPADTLTETVNLWEP